jgi:hypothetical protein
MLDYVALFVIFFLMIAATAAILFVGSLPAYIARKRGHPWVDAVDSASWMGHIFIFIPLFPLALLCAFLPFRAPGAGSTSDAPEAQDDRDKLRERVATLEETVARIQAQRGSDK